MDRIPWPAFARMACLAIMVWAVAWPLSAAEAFRTVSRGTVGSDAKEAVRLKWLPHRPSMPALQPVRSGAPQYQAAKPPAVFVQHSTTNPFKDPFGDGTAAAPSGPEAGADAVPLLQPGAEDADPAYPAEEPNPGTWRAEDPAPDSQPLTLADELGGEDLDLDYACPSLDELKPISKITYRTTPEAGELPRDCTLGERELKPRSWAQTTFLWKASGMCHKPLYFEDVHLERYGHSWGPLLQPVVSGAHFFGNVIALPYKVGMDPPHECMYTLGYYRPGNCAPYMLDPIPLSVRGAVVAGGIWAGGIYAIP